MAEREFILGGGARRDPGELVFAETADGGVPPRRLLGMARAGVVLFGDGIGQKRGAQVYPAFQFSLKKCTTFLPDSSV